ncbi:MAG TPA: nitrate ABC transporter ATP-binding protein [Ruminococcaceae bacterium]|nr:nitrate ABC transporter ATP-binding protein [Oscillospiraceae bacterium]
MEILKAENITKSFGDNLVLKDISITLNEGEIVGLLGVSGSGKTTLLNILSGIYTPDSGRVYLKGEDITGKPGEISYMLQKDLLFEYRRVIDNVTLPLILNGMSKKESREKVYPLFETFGIDGTQMQYPCELSGGMRQRAALLRTYLSSKGVALLDEPFSALDTITKSKIHKWYLDIMQNINLSTVFITHDIDEAILLSDRIYILTSNSTTEELVIDVAKPRKSDFNLTDEFLEYKRKIVEILG